MSMIHNGIAGMNVASTALMVTSTNIANASVAGYSRQQAMFSTSGTGGVYVSDIQRVSDQFYVSQVQTASTSLGYATTKASQINLLEVTLSSESMSLSPALNDFFNSLDSAQADPMDIAYRQEVLFGAENVASRYNGLVSDMNKQLDEVNKQVDVMVGEVNTLMNRIAELNTEIQKAEAAGGASAALLDERDRSVQQLSELVGVESMIQPDNTVNLYLPSGEPLVTGGTASELVVEKGNSPWESSVALKTGSHTKPINDIGGAVQGQLDFRDEVLAPAYDDLMLIGEVLAEEFNAVLTQGYDLNGDPGEPLFEFTSNGELKVLIDDPAKLAFSSDPDEPGNNENLMALSDLRHEKWEELGDLSFTDAYNGLVIDVAGKASDAMNQYDAAALVYNEAFNNVASVSGVNMDEEAANLIVFQQAYAANAKVIASANDMMNMLLAI
ncbi:flagellar hook-associated protein FlgK [Endozoicomonas lisbonensis]|uniref:Flagellar hook-associated protein 1 n=1 Tax=Endozoicomonas lisbonensis TaxID=3120522 RepID=A0ABV2SD50_9GAMM